MDADSNETCMTFGGHVEVGKYRYIYFAVMFTAYALIIFSNFTIVYLVLIHRNLHEPMYVFIAALCLNSVLFSTAIYPKLLIDYLSERQVISISMCLFQFYAFYSLAGTDFLLLAAMAYDRYVAICKPLHYPTIMRKKTVCIFLGVSWLLPGCELVGTVSMIADLKLCKFTLSGIFCNNSLFKLHCVSSTTVFVYGLIVTFNNGLLPVLFIVFTYTRIFIIARCSCREIRKKAMETCVPHLLVLICFFCICLYDVIAARLESHIPKMVHLTMTVQFILYNPLLNPIIYGLKMKEIFQHLRKLFC